MVQPHVGSGHGNLFGGGHGNLLGGGMGTCLEVSMETCIPGGVVAVGSDALAWNCD